MRMVRTLLSLACLGVLAMPGVHAAEESWLPWLPKAPKLPPPQGRVVNVADVDGFRKAVTGAKDGDTIVLADGTYRCVPYVWMRDKKHITIRSASGDPAKVKLTGKGWDQGGDHTDEDIFWLDSSEYITFADLTFTETHAYGLKINAEGKPKNIKVWNCHFRDIGIRGIKGTGGESKTGSVTGGEVRYCWFENTKIPPVTWQFNGDYITSIDMMRLDQWVFADNVFKNIKGKNGQARGAVFVWVESKNVTVERNVFLDCDRGVCFGNPSNPDKLVHMRDSICRNNFFVSSNYDAMIEVGWAQNIKVLHNTVVKTGPKSHNNRGVRVVADSKYENIEIANNIVTGGGIEFGAVKDRNNYTGPCEHYFVDLAYGNLNLTAAAVGAINKGEPLDDAKEDFGGLARDPAPDLGASEFGAKPKVAAILPGVKSAGNAATAPASVPKEPAKQIDAAPHRDAIAQMLQKSAPKPGVKVFITLFGKSTEVALKSADAAGIQVLVQGNAMPLRWKDLLDADYTQLAWCLRPDDADALVHAGALAACAGNDALREKIHLKLVELSPEKARALDKLAGQ